MSEHVTTRATDQLDQVDQLDQLGQVDQLDQAETSGAATDVVTAAARTYTVVADVNVRSGPSTSYAIVGRLRAGARVTLQCQRPGQTITGPTGTSSIWDRIGAGRFISDTYVRTGSDGYVAPRC